MLRVKKCDRKLPIFSIHNMNKLFVGITIFSLLLVAGSYIVLNSPGKSQPKVLSFTSQDKEKPTVETKEIAKDLGTIKVADIQKVTFTVKNIGTKPLQLSNITSSCGCTAGQIIYNGVESKEYSMHSQSDDVFEIAPQTTAQVRVTYRPFTMPVYGLVEREVYISTNDPSNSKLVFKVKAVVN